MKDFERITRLEGEILSLSLRVEALRQVISETLDIIKTQNKLIQAGIQTRINERNSKL